MKNRKYLFFLRKKLFKIISCILSILFLVAFPVSAETGTASDISFTLVECYLYNVSDGGYLPLVFSVSPAGNDVIVRSSKWITNVDGDTSNISIPSLSDFVVRFVFSFSYDFQPDGTLVNAFDLSFTANNSAIAASDFLNDGNYGELRSYTSSEGAAQVVSTIYPSVTNGRTWTFNSPESRPGVSIIHYAVDLKCINYSALSSLIFRISGNVTSGYSGPSFPSYVPPDGSTIDNYNQIEGDLIGSVTDNAAASRDEVESSLNNTVTTYGGAFAAVGRFISDIVYIPKINGLVYFSLGIAVVPLIVGMTINGLRSQDRQASRARFRDRYLEAVRSGQRKD